MKKWLFLGMPWSTYTCPQCGSIFAGTLLRTVLITVSSGFLGYVVVGVIKGKVNLFLLPPALVVTLVILFVNLPLQVKKVGERIEPNDSTSDDEESIT